MQHPVKKIYIIIGLLHPANVFGSATQTDIQANCAQQLLKLSIAHIQSPQDTQIAQKIIILLDKKCPTSSPTKLSQLAAEAAEHVPINYYGWWHVCKEEYPDKKYEPKCQRYGEYVKTAEQLLFHSENFFNKIGTIAQQPKPTPER